MEEICLTIERNDQSSADGIFKIRAPGCIAAELFWADRRGKELPHWTSFAFIQLISGRGNFEFSGGRAIPEKAETVLCRAVSEDCSRISECVQEIPGGKDNLSGGGYCFVVASDLHLSNKKAPLSRLYDFAVGSDGLLLAGDTVNDGTIGQFEFVKTCVTDKWKKYGIFLPIYAVAGNHDIPLKPLPSVAEEGQGGYPEFQRWLQGREKGFGNVWSHDASGAYSVSLGESIELIGLQCVSHYRRFVFREGRQLDWLEKHLEETDALRWHIILCHAPLLAHNPQRRTGSDAPYLSRDKVLQNILDTHHNLLFITGHTHFSLNNFSGCVEWDAARNNLYLNAGSIRKTTMSSKEMLVPSAWTEGCAILLRISEDDLEITAVGLSSGNRQARGHYHFRTT